MERGDDGAASVSRRLRQAGTLLAAATIVCAAIGLWMWFSSPGRPADIGGGYVPMAPTSGLAMLALGACAMVRLRTRRRRRVQLVVDTAALAVVTAAAVILAARLADAILSFERAVAPAADVSALRPQGIMSPVTAVLFILCGIFLLLVRSGASIPRWRHVTAMAIATIVSVAGLSIVTGYVYNSPFLYGLGLIPVAFMTGLAFLLLGACCWTLLPGDRWPMAALLRPSVTTRLLVVFVPLVLAVVLVGGAIQLRVLPHVASPAEAALLAALATGILAVFVTRAAAVRIGGSADSQAIGHQAEARDAQDRAAELEQGVAERTRDLTLANAELEEFVYSIAHDLRSPLRAIAGFSEIVTVDYADVVDDSGRDYLRRIHSAAVHMGEVLDALLALSRVNRTDLLVQDVDLSALARQVTDQLREAEPQRSVELEIEDGLTVTADASLCEVLLQNLIGNAWKFTARERPARISFGRSVDGRSAYCVGDNGVGFEQKYADRLFRPFERLHTPEEFPGTGIGLATVGRIVARFEGDCWAEGRVGEGARVFFTLPAPESAG